MILQILIPSIIIATLLIFTVCEIVNISVFKQYNKDKSILDFYDFVRLFKIDNIDLSYSISGPIIASRYYHVKIIDEDKVILFDCSTTNRINSVYLIDCKDDEQTEVKYTLPLGRASWLLSYRMNKIEKYMEVSKLEHIKPEELNKEVNKHLKTYNRQSRLKKLGI